MGLLKEFKDFAMRGNVIDMAVGIVLGASFKEIVTALVNNVIMPPLGYFTGKVDFAALAIDLPVPDGDPVKIGYGLFINAIISFIIMAFAIFMVIKAMNKASELSKPDEEETPAEPTTKNCDYCQSEISIKATRCPNCTSELATS